MMRPVHGHCHDGRFAERATDSGADEHEEQEQCPLVDHTTDHEENDGDDGAEGRQDDGQLASDTITPRAAEQQQQHGRQVDDELVVHQVDGGRRLDVVLLVRTLNQLRTSQLRGVVVRRQLLSTHALRYVQPHARLQQRFADLEQEEDDFSSASPLSRSKVCWFK